MLTNVAMIWSGEPSSVHPCTRLAISVGDGGAGPFQARIASWSQKLGKLERDGKERSKPNWSTSSAMASTRCCQTERHEVRSAVSASVVASTSASASAVGCSLAA